MLHKAFRIAHRAALVMQEYNYTWQSRGGKYSD